MAKRVRKSRAKVTVKAKAKARRTRRKVAKKVVRARKPRVRAIAAAPELIPKSMPMSKAGYVPMSAKTRAKCLKVSKRRKHTKASAILALLCREHKTKGVVAKYRRILAAVDPRFLAAVGSDDDAVLLYWAQNLRQYVGPFSASPAQEAEFVQYALTHGLEQDSATNDAIARALAPKDRQLLKAAYGED